MIVIDGSALFAILLDEEPAERCIAAIERADAMSMSAGSLTEALIVAARKDVGLQMARMIDGLRPTIVLLTAERAYAAAEAYRRWGKGFNAARLNMGDSFAYALAIELACPLLYVGNDFARTDVKRAA